MLVPHLDRPLISVPQVTDGNRVTDVVTEGLSQLNSTQPPFKTQIRRLL